MTESGEQSQPAGEPRRQRLQGETPRQRPRYLTLLPRPHGEHRPPRPGSWGFGPALAISVTVILWASAFIGIRYAGPYFSPGPLALLRLAVGAAVLGAMAAVRRDPLPKGRDWWPILTIGVLWFCIYNIALNAGERLIDAGTASLVINASPVLIAVLAALFLKEAFTWWLAAGLVVAFAGSTVVGFASSDGASSDPVLGVLFALIAAVVYSVSVILQKGVLQRVSAIQVTFLACMTGLACTLPFTPQLVREIAVAPASATWFVAYLGLFPTAIAFTTWAYALRTVPAGRLGVTTYAVPVIVVFMSWLMLDEVPTVGALLGGALCLVGVAISRRGQAVASPASRP